MAAQQKPLAIVGGMLIDGNGGTPVHDSVVLIRGERIAALGRRGAVEIPADAQIIDARGMTVMPGLFDLHVHLDVMGHGNYDVYFPKYKDRLRREIMPANARELLMHGVTSARDPGANLENIIDVRDRIKRDEIPGPRLFACGPYLQKTLPSSGSYSHEVQAFFRWTVNGAEDARAKTRKVIDAGLDCVKIIQGWEMSQEELAAIIDEAHKAGRTVASHGETEEEIRKVVNAGVDSIEHTGLSGTGNLLFSDDVIRLLIDKKTTVVPTYIVSWAYKITQEFPERRYNQEVRKDFSPDLAKDTEDSFNDFEHLQYFRNSADRYEAASRRLRQMIESDVHIVMGTDSGTPLNFHTEAAWREIAIYVQHGMTPLQAITSATKYPAQFFKLDKDLGTLEAGKLGDVIVVRGNVLESINYLRDIEHVIKGGKIYK